MIRKLFDFFNKNGCRDDKNYTRTKGYEFGIVTLTTECIYSAFGESRTGIFTKDDKGVWSWHPLALIVTNYGNSEHMHTYNSVHLDMISAKLKELNQD